MLKLLAYCSSDCIYEKVFFAVRRLGLSHLKGIKLWNQFNNIYGFICKNICLVWFVTCLYIPLKLVFCFVLFLFRIAKKSWLMGSYLAASRSCVHLLYISPKKKQLWLWQADTWALHFNSNSKHTLWYNDQVKGQRVWCLVWHYDWFSTQEFQRLTTFREF